ncbi:phytanoyl-CoA dioxygenase family protein [Hyphobacterium sp. CCMP332]|nr:phytanoyl-CoA dioxygenase family protein [Hyphobacterium sp. CCMP332]
MKQYDKQSFLEEFNDKGYVIIDNVVDSDFIKRATKELELALKKELEFVGTKDYKFYGYVLSNAKYGGAFLDLLDNKKVTDPMDWVLGENSILYSYTSSSMPPKSGNDSSHVHVDCPIYLDDYILRMGVLIPLVDFTPENGATYYLEGSQKSEQMPDDDEFYKNAQRLTIKAGTAWFFNTRMWHAGGKNNSESWRHAITLNVCRPWMKQYIDTPRLLKDIDLSNVSEKVLQKLGFYSQPPTSYEEYFDPNRKRLFL